jgi:hypothetical protein
MEVPSEKRLKILHGISSQEVLLHLNKNLNY